MSARKENAAISAGYVPRDEGVRITGIDIPFGDIFVLLLKVAIASIPVGIVVGIGYLILMLVFAAVIS